jgi:hypothetical protein
LGKKSKVPTVVSRFLALHAATQKKKNWASEYTFRFSLSQTVPMLMRDNFKYRVFDKLECLHEKQLVLMDFRINLMKPYASCHGR